MVLPRRDRFFHRSGLARPEGRNRRPSVRGLLTGLMRLRVSCGHSWLWLRGLALARLQRLRGWARLELPQAAPVVRARAGCGLQADWAQVELSIRWGWGEVSRRYSKC